MASEETFTCIFCKEIFSDKETLQIHFRKHGDPSFNQNKTKRSPQKDNIVEKATPVENKADLVSCDVCDEVFPTISKAITHKHKVHPDHDAKYFCHWCGKLFTMKHLYNKHMVTHKALVQGNDIFHCDSCDVDFYLVTAMMYHNKFFHRQETELPDIGHSKKQKHFNTELIPVYYCPFCGEEYINKVNLHKHISDDHGDENQTPNEVLRCPLCDAIFYHLDAYEWHLTFHSSEDIFNGSDMNAQEISEFTLDSVPPGVEKVELADEALDVNALLQLAVNDDTQDSTSSEKKKHKKKKKHKRSKKEAITLDEFLSMNEDVFGEGLNVHGIEEVPTKVVTKTLKMKPQKLMPTPAVKSAKTELEKLKLKGIIVKKTKPPTNDESCYTVGPLKMSKNIVISKNAPQPSSTKATDTPSSKDVLSKFLNSGSQITIAKKSTSDSLEDSKSPHITASTPENIEVDCDLPPSGSSDADVNETGRSESNGNNEAENKLKDNNDSEILNKVNTTIPEDALNGNINPLKETKNEMILKNIGSNLTIKTISKKSSSENKNLQCSDIHFKNNTVDETQNMDSNTLKSQPLISTVLVKEGNPLDGSNKSENKEMDNTTNMNKEDPDLAIKSLSKNLVQSEPDQEKLGKDNFEKIHNPTSTNVASQLGDESEVDSCPIIRNKIDCKNKASLGNKVSGHTVKPVSNENTTKENYFGNEPYLKHSDSDASDYDNLDDNCEKQSLKTQTAATNKIVNKYNSDEDIDTKECGTNIDDDNNQAILKKLCGQITIKSSLNKTNKTENILPKNGKSNECDKDVECKTESTEKVKNMIETEEKQVIDQVSTSNLKHIDALKKLSHLTVKQNQNKNVSMINPKENKTCANSNTVKFNTIKLKVPPTMNLQSNFMHKDSSEEHVTNTDEDWDSFDEEPLANNSSTPMKIGNTVLKPISNKNTTTKITMKVAASCKKNITGPQINKNVKGTTPNNIRSGNIKPLLKEGTLSTTESEFYVIDDSDSDDNNEDATKNDDATVKCSPQVHQSSAKKTPSSLRQFRVQPAQTSSPKNETVSNGKKTDTEHNKIQSNSTKNPASEHLESVKQKLKGNCNLTLKPVIENAKIVKDFPELKEEEIKNNELVLYKPPPQVSSDSESDRFSDDNEYIKPMAQKIHKSSNIKVLGNDITVKCLNEIKFDDDDDFDDDFPPDDDEEPPNTMESNSVLDKLKSLGSHLSIKSNTRVTPQNVQGNKQLGMPKTHLQNRSNTLKREVPDDFSDDDMEDIKQTKINKNSNEKCVPKQNLEKPSTSKSIDQQQESTSNNTVSKHVTQSVKTFQTETVVEEVTTTVTRTIKTIHHAKNETTVSGQQIVRNTQPKGKITSNMRPNIPQANLQGISVRQPTPQCRPRIPRNVAIRSGAIMKPVNNTINIRPNQTQIRGNAPRMPMMAKSPISRPLKMSPNAIQGSTCKETSKIVKQSQTFQNNGNVIQMKAQSSQVVRNASKSFVSNSPNSMTCKTKVQSEVSQSSHQEMRRVNNVGGTNVVKSSMSQSKVTTKQEKTVSASQKNTLDTIERLMQQGLIKKPRLEEVNEDMDSDGEGHQLAIENVH